MSSNQKVQRHCYRCNCLITSENESEEHIIINAAGGRLTSKDLLCKACNAKFGETVDSALAQQLNPIANFLMIKRHRGEPQPITAVDEATGKKYFLEVGGKPKATKPDVIKSTNGKQVNFSISARSEEELRKIIAGIGKDHKHFDIDGAMKHARWNNKEFTEPLHFAVTVGGIEVFRAVCKCALNFFLYSGGDSSDIKHLLHFIEGKK